MYFYSPSTGAFYIESSHGERLRANTDSGVGAPNPDCKIPTDAVELTDAAHSELLDAQATGKVIQPDNSGRPVAMARPSPPLDVLKAMAIVEVRALRAALFPTLAGLQSEATARGNAVDAVAIAAVQLGCRNITQTNLSACTTKPQIDAAFLAAWIAIVAAAPISVRLAFAELKK